MAEFTFLSLLLAYVVTDYIFQIASEDKWLGSHLLLVLGLSITILSCLVAYLAVNRVHGAIEWLNVIGGLWIMVLFHWGLDKTAVGVVNKFQNEHTGWITYLGKQSLQWIVLWVVSMYIPFFSNVSGLHANANVNLAWNIMLVIVGGIITSRGVKILIKEIMSADEKEDAPQKGLTSGTTIGIVERLLILLGTLIGQLTPTLAGIIAIKSIGRFQQINDSSDYAEYYMVGSLLSIGFGIAVAQIVKMNLNYFA